MEDILRELTDDDDFLELLQIVLPRIRRNQPRTYRSRLDPFQYYGAEEFLARYRLPKENVRILIDMISDGIKSATNWNHAVTPEQKVLVTLRFYATGTIQQCMGDLQGIDKSSVSRAVKCVSVAIASLYREFVKMPETQDERQKKMKDFYNFAKFPRCLAAVDCTHIKIQSPGGEQAELYRNRKDYFSYNVQALCDANLFLLDVVCRWPGSSHDSTIFNNSNVRRRFERGDFDECVILGDSGYGVKPYLMTPLTNPNDRAEQLYNESHIRSRNVIERCFGVLKRRFPCLALGLKIKTETVPSVVYACAVLHNIARSMSLPEPPVCNEVLQGIENNNVELLPRLDRDNFGVNGAVRRGIIQQHFARLF